MNYNTSMSASKVLLTAEEFDHYPFEESKRYELDDGELIEMTRPAYKHNRIMRKLVVALANYLDSTGRGEVMLSENLYALSSSTRRSPDVAVFLGDRSAELENAKVIHIPPDIAAEILSPSESQRAIHRKLKQYFDAGVKEVWVIDPESKEVEIWTGPQLPEHELAADGAITSAWLPDFALPLKDLFA